MPRLPKNNVVVAPSKKEAPQPSPIYGAAARMRVGISDHTKGKPQKVLALTTSPTDAAREDVIDRRLFLRTLQEMIGDETAEKLEKAHIDAASDSHGDGKFKLYGSQVLITLRDFGHSPLAFKAGTKLGPPETTTRFGFLFNFAEVKEKKSSYGTARYTFDREPMRILHSHGISEKQTEAYYRGFLKMAGMAEHDYIHQLTVKPAEHTNYDFPDRKQPLLKKHPLPHTLEMFSLGLHAQVCSRLFGEDAPHGELSVEEEKTEAQRRAIGQRRKQHVLGWAADQFTLIADMQEQALAHATTPEEREHIYEATTYLAEVYGHRLFRVISPDDPALREAVSATLDRLQLRSPRQLGGLGARGELSSGLDALTGLCSYFLQDTYREIHRMRTIPLSVREPFLTTGSTFHRSNTEELPLPTVMARFLEGVAPCRESWGEQVANETDGAKQNIWR